MGIGNTISFLDLPPELRIQIYKLLLRKNHYCDHDYHIRLGQTGPEKDNSEDKQNITEKISLRPAVSFIYPIMQLFLTNKQIYLEAVHIFYTHGIFYARIQLGEKDWQTIYKWLVMIGPHNRKNLRKLWIVYNCLEWAAILEDGRAGERWVTKIVGGNYWQPSHWCSVRLSPTREWVELISPTIEKIFKLLGECRNVIVTFDQWEGELLGRVLYPRLYEAENGKQYPNTEWFGMLYERHVPYSMENAQYDNSLYGEYDFYGPPTRSLLPDLMELYRTRYGGNSISVLWSVNSHWLKREVSWRRSMVERSGWDILRLETHFLTSHSAVSMDLKKRSKNLQELAAQPTGDLQADINLCMRCSDDAD